MINLKEAGATGDGKTDDTLAIEAALELGQSIYVPEGQYRFTRTLDFHGLTIVGDGFHRSEFKPMGLDADYDWAITPLHPAGFPAAVIVGNESSNFTKSYGTRLENFGIDCEGIPGCAGIFCFGSLGEGTAFRHLRIAHYGSYGLANSWRRHRTHPEGNAEKHPYGYWQCVEISNCHFVNPDPRRRTVGIVTGRGITGSISHTSIAASHTCIMATGGSWDTETHSLGAFLVGPAMHLEGNGIDTVGIDGRNQFDPRTPTEVVLTGINHRGLAESVKWE